MFIITIILFLAKKSFSCSVDRPVGDDCSLTQTRPVFPGTNIMSHCCSALPEHRTVKQLQVELCVPVWKHAPEETCAQTLTESRPHSASVSLLLSHPGGWVEDCPDHLTVVTDLFVVVNKSIVLVHSVYPQLWCLLFNPMNHKNVIWIKRI